MKTERINVKVSKEEKKLFYSMCDKNRHTPSDIIRILMYIYTNNPNIIKKDYLFE